MVQTNLRDSLKELIECSICFDEFKDPRVLPCIHTFCLECLEKSVGYVETGMEMSCPLCREEFTIPENGMKDLKKNFFMQSLIQMRENSQSHDESDKEESDNEKFENCDACKSPVGKMDTAKMYCRECSWNLCEDCSREHAQNNILKTHKLVELGSQVRRYTRKIFKSSCKKHGGEELKLYCITCETTICLLCFSEDHNSHKCAAVHSVVDGFRSRIHSIGEQISVQLSNSLKKKIKLDEEKITFLVGLTKVEKSVLDRAEEIKRIANEHAKLILGELEALKNKRLKELEFACNEIKDHQMMLDNFKKYATKIKDVESNSEICSSIKDLNLRAARLKRTSWTLLENDETSISVPSFKSTSLYKIEYHDKELNIVGSLDEGTQLPPIVSDYEETISDDASEQGNFSTIAYQFWGIKMNIYFSSCYEGFLVCLEEVL